MKQKIYLTSVAFALAAGAYAASILSVPMDLHGSYISETVSATSIPVYGVRAAENIPGASGHALRFDGYSTYAQGNLAAGEKSMQKATVSLWVAPETYPVVALDERTDEKICMAGTLDESARTGWQFALGNTGKYAFEFYSVGMKVSVPASDLLPCYEWSHLVAVIDAAAKCATLYRNGVKVGEARCMALDNSASKLMIGKSAAVSQTGPFHINTFNGLLDDLEMRDEALTEAQVKAYKAENKADLTVPASRFEAQLMRPRFHGMPGANWTNECHGLTYSSGRYHLFFQKNANGPYMTRLHWGHISSPDLCTWREEPIAIAPGDSYDIKGCWSGAVFTDPVLTGGKPGAIYTAVDYGRATICMANPADDDLIKWNKQGNNPIINGRPAGLSDDFRDPNFFRNGDNAYIIVGSSKNGVGTTTLHRMDPATKTFTNNGSLFFTGTNASFDGTFWEMPTINQMEGGKWLFTATPLGTSSGVRCQYWVGSINADGTFKADSPYAKTVEMSARDGYGLLSPSIYKHEGKTIALGIVPDKLSGDRNYELGWAHCYSLPREWSLDASGRLLQKPYEGLKALRGEGETLAAQTLNGTVSLSKVSGRQAEIIVVFEAGSAPCGIKFLGNGNGEGILTYSGSNVKVDLTGIKRWENDAPYKGVYTLPLGETPAAGSEVKLHLFIDGSILDIFVNDKWAQSIRIFATDSDAATISVFGTGAKLKSLQAWNLKASGSGVYDIFTDSSSETDSRIFDINGRLVAAGTTEALAPGIYVMDGRKILVK